MSWFKNRLQAILVGVALATSAPASIAEAARLAPAHSQGDVPEVGPFADRVQALADRARAAYLAQDYARAIVLYGKLIRVRPRDWALWYNKANAYYAARDMSRAIAAYSRALSFNPESHLSLMGRGNAYSQTRRFSEAIADFDRAIALNPDEFLVWYNRGIAKGRIGDKDGALNDLTEAIGRRPNDPQSFAARGDVRFSQENKIEARADYERALALDPANAHAAEKLKLLSGVVVGAPGQIETERTSPDDVRKNGANTIAKLAMMACFTNGADESGMRKLAQSSGWRFVGESELQARSSSASLMVGGWTFETNDGAFAVMQSRENVSPVVHVCSVTTKLNAVVRFGAIKSAFETITGAAESDVSAQQRQESFGYWLVHTPECETRISLVHKSFVVTVRMLHGRVRGANTGDQSYPNMGAP